MLRKISRLIVLSVFIISSTGLPLVLHICSMKGLSPVENCEMHKMKSLDHSCCNKEDAVPVKITQSNFDNCCQFRVVERNTTDQFVQTGSDFSQVQSHKVLFAVCTDTYTSPVISSNFNFSSSSPPSNSDNHIYLFNSVFLI